MKIPIRGAAGRESGGSILNSSSFERVDAISIAALCGDDGEVHLLAERTRDEAPDRMRLPVGCLHDLLEAGSIRSLDQAKDKVRLAALAGGSLLRLLRDSCIEALDGGPDA